MEAPRKARTLAHARAMRDAVSDLYFRMCGIFYGIVQDEYEYTQSEEYVRDVMEANGYTFTKDGKRFG